MLFSREETSNKAAVYVGIPNNDKNGMATKWLKSALVPINGKGGGKGGVAQGQVSKYV